MPIAKVTGRVSMSFGGAELHGTCGVGINQATSDTKLCRRIEHLMTTRTKALAGVAGSLRTPGRDYRIHHEVIKTTLALRSPHASDRSEVKRTLFIYI